MNETTFPSRRNGKSKQKDGVATRVSSRTAKSGNYAHSCVIGDEKFTLFSVEDFCPFSDGDRISFEYEVKRLRTGSKFPYNSIIPETLALAVPADLAETVSGHVYVLSNRSMSGLLKIGFTNGEPAKRAAELSGVTGVPTPFRVEWSMPVIGNARAIEQRIHAALHASRHGKEFFKVSVEEAKSAARGCYAELYPDEIAKLDAALTAAQLEAVERRKAIALEHERRAQEKREKEKREAFERSPEQVWLRDGSCSIQVKDYHQQPRPGKPGLLSKLFGQHFPDYIEVRINGGTGNAAASQWTVLAHGLTQGQWFNRNGNFATFQEARDFASGCARATAPYNEKWTVNVPNVMLVSPPAWYPNTGRTVQLRSLTGLELKPDYGSFT